MVQFPYQPMNGRMGWLANKFGWVPVARWLSGNPAECFNLI